MLRNRWLKLLLLFFLCLSLGLVDAVRSFTAAYHDGTFHLDWQTALRWDVTGWMTWIFFVPLVLHLSRRFPLNEKGWLPGVPIFLALGAVMTVIKTAVPLFLFSTFDLNSSSVFTWLSRRPWLLTDLLAAFVVYCFVLTFAQALNFHRQYREEELRASRLESEFARAELQALKMQLNPHFLFNTLHSISALQYENVEAAQTMTARLGDFLRLTLDNSAAQLVSLSREVDFLKCYLNIERVRFGNRLTTDFEIAQETLAAEVPNLILQPLVENAIKHGIAKQAKTGLIRVAARVENEMLRLEVMDNGAGLAHSLNGNNNNMNNFPHHGLGLSNVRERLRQLYGANHSFEFERASEGGLLVAISIPLRFAKPDVNSFNHVA